MNTIYSFYTDKELVSLALNAAQTPLELELTKRLEALLAELAKKAGA